MADREVSVKLNVVPGNMPGAQAFAGVGRGIQQAGGGGVGAAVLGGFQGGGMGGAFGALLGKAGLYGALAGIALNQITDLMDKVVGIFENAAGAILQGVSKASPATFERWTMAWDNLSAAIGGPWIGVLTDATRVVQLFANMVGGIGKEIQPLINQLRLTPTMFAQLKSTFAGLGAATVQLFTAANKLFQNLGGMPALINATAFSLNVLSGSLVVLSDIIDKMFPNKGKGAGFLSGILGGGLLGFLADKGKGAGGGFEMPDVRAARPAQYEGLFERGAAIRLSALSQGRDPATDTAKNTQDMKGLLADILKALTNGDDPHGIREWLKKWGVG